MNLWCRERDQLLYRFFPFCPNARSLEIQITSAPASQAIAEKQRKQLFFTFGPHHLQSFSSILPNWFAQQPILGFSGGSVGKESSCNVREQGTWVQSLGREDPLEKGMATNSGILVWRIPWTEEPGGLQSTGSQRVRHDWGDWAQHTAHFIGN